MESNNRKITTKDRLQALRIILQADIARFELLCKGEVVMSVKSLNERINAIKLDQGQGPAVVVLIAILSCRLSC